MKLLKEFGQFIQMFNGMLRMPENKKMYWKQFMLQCNDIGIGSLGIVCIISFFIGAVSTVQTAYQLVSPIIPKTTIAQIVRDSVILEFAPTLSCIVLAGVVGSKIASELGNMRVSEQIDALEIMGINTKAYLILPKIVAGVITIPLLIILSMLLGIWGGRLAGSAAGIIDPSIFDKGLLMSFNGYNVFFSLIKSFAFAFIITSVPSFYGYTVKGGALEIGHASTRAVVISCILLLLADYVLSALLL
ncbi:MAG TPA: ABC transporter permease [Niabella sp.]|nr:ABC transporter permease [Niabella sp.]HOZ95557.1 ABC transporter permease [Niabella sp.]HQW13797.1 ABC transporter permease [Niabella sp.]HQX19310.1 ABC transporter permease [Niabella sp.]HQX40834.1 ABC transporter permease [Niabella sp.]